MARDKILLVSDEQHLCQAVGWALEYKGYQVEFAASPDATIEALVKKNYDLVIAKLIREDFRRLEVLRRAKKLNPAVKVMMIGVRQHMTFPPEAYRIEVDDYLLIPISPSELWRRVSRCLEKVVDLETGQKGRILNPPVRLRIFTNPSRELS